LLRDGADLAAGIAGRSGWPRRNGAWKASLAARATLRGSQRMVAGLPVCRVRPVLVAAALTMSGSPLALITSSLRSKSKKRFCLMIRLLHRVRSASQIRSDL